MDIQNKELRFSEAGESLIGKEFRILDKGSISLVSYHGTDALIEAAARVSYQKGTRKVSDTRNLLRYLYRAEHCSPFEISNLTFKLKAPLFVIQQILRHRTAKLNQESHRYSEITDDFYSLEPDEWRLQSSSNKQGSDGLLDLGIGTLLSKEQDIIHDKVYNNYQSRILQGVAKEIARKDMPVSTYSSLYWQSDIRNLLHFCTLRCDSHAQLEVRKYAEFMAAAIKELFPICYEAWIDYAHCSSNWTRLDKEFLKIVNEYLTEPNPRASYESWENYNKIEPKNYERIGMSKREYNEFWEKLNPPEVPNFDISNYEEINVN